MERTYTDSLYYQLRITAKYMKVFGSQMFKKLGILLNFDEFVVLDLLSKNKDICLRDLAKIILKDRANTGRLANALEKKGLIELVVTKRDNKLVKIITLTDSGKNIFKESRNKIEPNIQELCGKIFNGDEEEKIIALLTDFREKMFSAMEVRI
ncbi:MarR family transcriptional regulator [bacterium]|nr:MarR family transcriptional regulator [bacterium]